MCAKPCQRKCLQNYANNLNKVELRQRKIRFIVVPESHFNEKYV